MLKIHAKKLGSVAVLGLEGQIVNGETEILRHVVNSLSETSAVILDLAQVSIIDAHGLGVMLELREKLEQNGTRLELRNVTRLVNRVLEITRLDTVFRITSRIEYFPTMACSQRASVVAAA